MGGIAALVDAATFLVGFALFLTTLSPLMRDESPEVIVAFPSKQQALAYLA